MATITGNSGANTLLGTSANDIITGGGGNDRLDSRGGNDTLNGGTGIDRLIGGTGNDIYIIDNATEIDKTLADSGTDTVRSTVSYTLGAQQELLTLTGTAALNGTGNATANILLGNSGANKLSGLGGNDTLTGNGGNDNLLGAAGNDTLTGGAGNDSLNGGTGDDRLLGGAGNDTAIFDTLDTRGVDGGAGTDTLRVNTAVNMDLVTLNATPRFTNIEIINLDTGRQVLVLDEATVLGLSDSINTIQIRGTTDDDVMAAGLWTNLGTAVIGAVTYDQFQSGDAILQVQDGIDVSGIFERTVVIELSALSGNNGFRLDGVNADDRSGWSVASAGDMNVDGFGDLIIGAPDSGNSFGESYVVFGKPSGFSSSLSLATLNGADGFRLGGSNPFSGVSVASAGDVNGDGFDDVIVGRFGDVHVVFGKASAFASTINLSVLNGSDGFRLDSINTGEGTGRSVASAGDMNGDGFDDLIIGAYRADPNGIDSGESYVVLGSGSFASDLDLSALNGTNGFRLNGIDAGDFSGFSVASAGDVNRDGFDDLIIGAYKADPNGIDSGESYVVLGSGSFASDLDLSALNGTNGFRLNGIDAGDFSGYSVASAGDVNGDGVGDVIIGAYGADPGGDSHAGESYVVFGMISGFGTSFELNALDGTNGFRLDGIDLGDYSGNSVASAGDVDGDGFDDLVIGAKWGNSPTGYADAGESYVVFGKAAGFASSLDLGVLNGADGFRLDGVDFLELSGKSVSAGGDVNGDGFGDLIVGTQETISGLAGKSYVIFGGDFRDQADFVGTDGNDVVTGMAVDEILIGGLGDDMLNGEGGNDVLTGASGNDGLNGGTGGDFLRGGTGNDLMDGGANNDRLFGDEGVDTLNGGLGNDTLDGDGDNDIFLFNDTLDASNVDTIMDFGGAGATALDVIHLDDAVFAALSAGALDPDAFESGAGLTAAATASGRIIYDTTSGALYYDADGMDGAAAVQFAVIASDVDGISAADFVVI